ncbi:unnamed protein product [Parnassius mnemosyne]|uniref:Tc1-like transposase DDE domain-containing protein n=1 Tax=Parnassius mnemosyne TaxID=213953 RepID=A0AAV1KD85_9NEOP
MQQEESCGENGPLRNTGVCKQFVNKQRKKKIIKYISRHWVFQQDSTPAHRAKSTQDWLAAREIDFIRHEDCPSSSPDLNPLDYKIWQHLEEKACSKPHPNLESLKTSLIKAAAVINMDLVRAAIDDWLRRLKACIQNHGGHFE